MKIFERLADLIANVAKRLLDFPRNLVKGVRANRVQAQSDAEEAERLDRLRNPSKYQGK